MEKVDWFKNWFNAPFYHILYKDRNDEEAKEFIETIMNFLSPPEGVHILDVPCGKGRHSKYLNSLGYKVTGADLSVKSIEFAKQFENENLSFEVHDIRTPFKHKYDIILNLFTSFGYFDQGNNSLVLQNIKNGLQPNGKFVIDFMNASFVKKHLVRNEIKVVDNIPFVIHREIKDGKILKHISFYHDDKQFHFTENVKYLDFSTLQKMLIAAGFKIEAIFGDYHLNSFDETSSDRLIFVAK